MRNKCKFIFILTFIIASLFYRVDSIVAMAVEETEAVEAETGPDLIAEPEPDTKSEIEAEPVTEPEVEPETEPEPITGPVVETESEFITESAVETEKTAELMAAPEAVMEVTAGLEATESISTGSALIEWLEAHKNTGGTVKLSDNVVLDGYYSFCPDGGNKPAVLVDTDHYTITVEGEVEFLSDNHLIFSGEPEGKSIFYVAKQGMLSMGGIVVESSQCALWQEEGAGLEVSDCLISGNIHYAEASFVTYYNDSICVVVEKGQTLSDVLPAQINCKVNRQGQVDHDQRIPVSWNLEGTEKQQEERRRFAVQGSFINAASAKPVQCTVVYNDAPLTFTDVTASVSGSLYTFQGRFTVPEESLPFTVMAEYSFDGENWFLYEEQDVINRDAGFYISCKSEPIGRAAHSNIYIRLQWDDNGTRYFSNVLCYAANDIESVEDIGGSRGGGTSIVNPPETPQESAGDVSSEKAEPDQVTGTSDGGHASKSEPVNADTKQPISAESVTVDAEQPISAEPVDTDAERPISAEPVDTDAEQPISAEPANVDIERPLSVMVQDINAGSTLYAENSANPSEMSEQTLRSDIRRNNNIVIVAGVAGLSVIAGAAGFCVHSLLGTKR